MVPLDMSNTSHSTSRRSFISQMVGTSLFLTGSGCAGLSRTSAAKKTHPNLIFILCDQLRACELGCYGHPAIQTPQIDQLAQEGTVFENATSCCPVCTPYRAGLLTGRYPLSTGMFLNDLRLPTDETTIGRVFHDAGYYTGYIGKWHLDGPYRGGFTPPGPRRHGFNDYWVAANCTHHYMQSFYYRDDPTPIRIDNYEPDIQTDLAINFIESAPQAQPFFLFLSYGTPHNPYQEMPDTYKIYNPETVAVRPNCPQPPRQDIAGYQSHISAVDRNVGRLMQTLDRLSLREETLVVFTSDHGDMLGSHGQQRKQRPWDESIRVPLIVRYPQTMPTQFRSNVLVNTPDLFPSLASLCHLPIPNAVEGEDQSARWTSAAELGPGSAFLASIVSFSEAKGFPEWRGVRTNRYTYISRQDGPWMLFDNLEDPYQTNNLIENTPFRSIRRRLEKELDHWLQQTGDTFSSPEDYLKQFGYAVDPDDRHIPYDNEIGHHDPSD